MSPKRRFIYATCPTVLAEMLYYETMPLEKNSIKGG